MAEPTDVQHLVKQLMAGASPEENRALLDALMSGQVSSIFEKLQATRSRRCARSRPRSAGSGCAWTCTARSRRCGGASSCPGDLTLPRLHDVIQAAMGWYDSHLHRFRTGNDHRSPYFVTNFDLDEGEDGVLEDDVRLDQLVADEGRRALVRVRLR